MEYKVVVRKVKWPGEETRSGDRKRGDFSITYARTLEHLEREVDCLDGSHVVFQLDVSEGQIRADHTGLYANQHPYTPGIVVTFNSAHGPLSYFCDRYTDWRSNLRAITITLQNLRRIDEHGVNQKGAQYEGYKQLPGVGGTVNGRPKIESPEQAAELIERITGAFQGAILQTPFLFESAHKEAMKSIHPDKGGTDADLWIDLQDAAAILRKHHGL